MVETIWILLRKEQSILDNIDQSLSNKKKKHVCVENRGDIFKQRPFHVMNWAINPHKSGIYLGKGRADISMILFSTQWSKTPLVGRREAVVSDSRAQSRIPHRCTEFSK